MSGRLKKWIALASLLTATSAMAAAGNDTPTTATATSSQPPSEMSALYPRIGTWQVVIRTEPGESAPKGGIDKGVMTIKKGPGGYSIVQDFWSRGSSGHTIGQSYTWWDTSAKAYKSVWCDNTQGCTEFVTVISGNSWTVEFDGLANGKKIHTTIHAVMSADRNTIHEEVANAYDGGPARTETISDYKRVKTSPNPADSQ